MKETYSEYRERMDYGAERSARYAVRKLKHRNEYDLVDKALTHIPKGISIVDVPCGGGRFSLHLASQGYVVSAGDRSPDMVRITQETLTEAGHDASVSVQDVESLSIDDRGVDAVFCFRLFHHIPDDPLRVKVVRELCRVSDQYVVMSYFNSRCLNMVRRNVRDGLKGKLYTKYGTPLSRVTQFFGEHGFELIADIPERRFLRPLHIAVFKRDK